MRGCATGQAQRCQGCARGIKQVQRALHNGAHGQGRSAAAATAARLACHGIVLATDEATQAGYMRAGARQRCSQRGRQLPRAAPRLRHQRIGQRRRARRSSQRRQRCHCKGQVPAARCNGGHKDHVSGRLWRWRVKRGAAVRQSRWWR